MTDILTDLPFTRYRGGGYRLLGKPRQGDLSCRHGYGPPVFAECGTDCAYCRRDLASRYEDWLDVSIDHVLPGNLKKVGWPTEWIEDIANLVTCCRACNEFTNQYKVDDEAPTTVDEFFALRDRHFVAKRSWVIERHMRERAWYDSWFALQRGPL